ncbi:MULTISPECIES: serine hydrolase [Olivibacter]|uniref:Serine hydrolase n=1 Tax=Olivibacter oleidegradans TaxID=760123 RepID=A0ABV6HJY6_9SPHI|nr:MULTISPECIES: serine hydrolase [Olivibacter]MCL4639988.1 class A beta-lactamase-related serine hydrolase [Olivibacter sp. UJ_SKK_5.1]MDM8175239.1 serine hydrolase [Olivibacter sp. 47]MDX3913082.1 serine hydrolase [Pseudosphingobacterium sp.]QEL02007.1 serine hydrolase [Olivibacter sp. LS-1]
MKILLPFCLLLISYKIYAQPMDTLFLKNLIESHPELFKAVLDDPQRKQVQILYTQIDRDKHNKPHFTSFSYRLNPNWYFYPASTVKLPASIFALEKINELKIKGLDKNTPLKIDSAWERQTRVEIDSSSANGLPSIGHYIKKILLTSDNDAFNRLYEFLGRADINRRLKKHGASHSRIINRLAIGDKGEWAKHTNPITFYKDDLLIYQQAAQYDPQDYPLDLQNLIRGKAYRDANDSLIHKPYSFEGLNAYALADQQLIMKKLLFPEAFPKKERFHLRDEDYRFIYYYMSRFPQESDFPKYDSTEFWPTYSKLLFFGREKGVHPDGRIRSFNKYGDSYGYNIDNAYIVDFKNGVEFLLTAVVQSNNNEIYNDSVYEYEEVTYPFLKNLGRLVYEHELKREKKVKPDLGKFIFGESLSQKLAD